MKPLSQDERQLVHRCLQGDRQAMEELVERFHKLVFGVCLRMVGNRHDAEDLTQETFLRVFRHLKSWDPSRPLRPWLLAIAGNRCRSFLAARRLSGQSLDLGLEIPQGHSTSADELYEEVQLGLARLRPPWRQAFLLFYEQELSYAEIAEVMNCPVGTVKTWIHRARGELVRFLKSRGTLQRG